MERLGHYEIVEKLGEGGMGVVYLARDTHLDRRVAIKVLPPGKEADRARRLRLVEEAKAASALSHPGIVTVHDVASDDGVDYIVMEHVQGTTLDALIPKKGLPLREALGYAVQIADAMAAAHEAGLVHRDLKPGNLMVTPAGRVKVLDFGLAKLRPQERVSEDAPTLTERTAEGTVVGTCAYMSPEQAEGRKVDARADVFSYGAVLYEMVTGQRAFKRDSQAATLAAVLRDEPAPPGQLVESLPPELERIVLRCLRKEPSRRFQTMADLRVALEEQREESDTRSGHRTAARATRGRWLPWLAAGLALAGAAAWFVHRYRPAALHATSPLPLTSFSGRIRNAAVSPDGKQVAFSWSGEKDDNYDLYVKLVGPGPPIRLTTDPSVEDSPAWSPDGQRIAFVRRWHQMRSAIVVIPALGGPERTVSEGAFGLGLAWSPDGASLIVPGRKRADAPHALSVLSLATGQWKPLTQPPAKAWSGDLWPTLSAGGELAFARGQTSANSEIYLLRLDKDLTPRGEPRRLTFEERASSQPAWSADGHWLVFASGAQQADFVATLMAIRASGPARKAEPLPGGATGEAPSISRTGNLVYVRALRDENIWRLPLVDGRPGRPERLLFSTRTDVEPRFSADGRQLLFTSNRSGSNEVWMCRADGSSPTQLTSTGANAARLSPDGKRVVLISNARGQFDLYVTTPNGAAPQLLDGDPSHDSAPSWSRDGGFVYFASNRQDDFQVWKMRPEPGAPPLRVTRHGGYAAIESVDGKTLYYARRDENAGWAIWKMPAGGGEETKLIPSLAAWGDFDVTDRGIFYVDSLGPGAKLRFYRFDDGSDSELLQLEHRPAFGLAASPDGRSVLFSQFDVDASELMLVESLR